MATMETTTEEFLETILERPAAPPKEEAEGEAEQDPAKANPLRYFRMARTYLSERAGL